MFLFLFQDETPDFKKFLFHSGERRIRSLGLADANWYI